MRLAFKIALRFLTSSKGQTLFIAIGIAVGVSVQIFIGSLIQGLQAGLVDTTIGNSSQITLTKETEVYDDYNQTINTVKNVEGVTEVSINTTAPSFLIDGEDTYPVVYRGFELKSAEGIYEFKERLYSGRLPNKENEIVLGKDLNEEIDMKLGDKIILRNVVGIEDEFLVVGFFDFKVRALNESWIIGNYQDVQTFFGFEDEISSIEIQVEDVFEADLIATDIEGLIDNDYIVTNWKAENEELLSGLNGQSVSSYMIQVFVIISVVLGIASVLAISVVQKSRQIGILKAMGIKDSTSSLIFLLQGFMLGVFGGVLGILLGFGLLYSFTAFALNPDGTPVVPVLINFNFIGFSALVAITASTLAALIPARRSSKLNPIEVIKNG
jgi:lipoprotein-releasing system permease protein